MSFLTPEQAEFFIRRDLRNEIILECLERPESSKHNGEYITFIDKNKKYKIWDGSWIESKEFFPKFGELREVLGVPFVLSGIDYSYPIFNRRATWSHWGGALTDLQKKKVLQVCLP